MSVCFDCLPVLPASGASVYAPVEVTARAKPISHVHCLRRFPKHVDHHTMTAKLGQLKKHPVNCLSVVANHMGPMHSNSLRVMLGIVHVYCGQLKFGAVLCVFVLCRFVSCGSDPIVSRDSHMDEKG